MNEPVRNPPKLKPCPLCGKLTTDYGGRFDFRDYSKTGTTFTGELKIEFEFFMERRRKKCWIKMV